LTYAMIWSSTEIEKIFISSFRFSELEQLSEVINSYF